MSSLITNAVVGDLDGVGGSPDGGVNEQTQGHHPQGQDRGTSGHADTGGGEDNVVVKRAFTMTYFNVRVSSIEKGCKDF